MSYQVVRRGRANKLLEVCGHSHATITEAKRECVARMMRTEIRTAHEAVIMERTDGAELSDHELVELEGA